jgi:hypothetical protein
MVLGGGAGHGDVTRPRCLLGKVGHAAGVGWALRFRRHGVHLGVEA